MKKWINTLLFSTLLAWCGYCVIYYVVQEVFIHQKDTQLTFKIKSDRDQALQFSYNNLPSQLGTTTHLRNIATSTSPQLIHLPFPEDLLLKRIYISSKSDSCSFELHSIAITGGYASLYWDANALVDVLKCGNESGASQTAYVPTAGYLNIELAKKHPILYVTSALTQEVYTAIHLRLRNLSAVAGACLWVLILLWLRFSTTKWAKPSTALNGCVLFLATVFTPFLTQKEHTTMENRTLAPFPNLKVNIWKLPKLYEAYYIDHFPFRNELSRMDNMLKIKLFHISPKPDNVQIGKENWLFCSEKEVRSAYQNISQFSPEQLELIKNNLERSARLLKKEGIDFYVMIPPLKHSIYPEYLPPTLRKRDGQNKRAMLMDYLKQHSSLQLIDPYPLLMAYKDTARVYLKNDTHWNQLGAFKVYQLMIAQMAKNHPQLTPLQLDQFDIRQKESYEGDLISMLNVANFFEGQPYYLDAKYRRKSGDAQVGPTIGSEQSYLYYEADSCNGLRLLVYRDSFTEYLRRHLAENFTYSGFSWDSRINPERIKQAHPNIVVYEVVERFIDRLLETD
jgi:alginate O-acetyltransferase complex protein AlgJ